MNAGKRSKRTRRKFTREFKAKVAVEAIKAQETINQIAARHWPSFSNTTITGAGTLLVTKGPDVGSILLTNHESLSADEFAPDFNSFLKTICTDPADLLVNTLGNYVRYRDGKTNKEWIPVEYLPDKDDKPARRRNKSD
jgi:hypothetical protein